MANTTCNKCDNPGHLRCTRCAGAARYCSVPCQRLDWPAHKTLCRPKEAAKKTAAAASAHSNVQLDDLIAIAVPWVENMNHGKLIPLKLVKAVEDKEKHTQYYFLELLDARTPDAAWRPEFESRMGGRSSTEYDRFRYGKHARACTNPSFILLTKHHFSLP